MMQPLRIAHRGGAGSVPENTVVAFRHAVARGYDLVETDVRATADGHLMLLHDDRLDRTTNGAGRLHDMTLEEVRRLDAGTKFAPEFAGEKVPTLEEALDVTRGSILLVEIKEPGLEERLLEALRRADAERRVVIQSFDAGIVRRMKALAPHLPYALLLSSVPNRQKGEAAGADALLSETLECGAHIVGLRGDSATPYLVESLRRRGVALWLWTLNRPEDIQRAKDAGVAGIISDYPERI